MGYTPSVRPAPRQAEKWTYEEVEQLRSLAQGRLRARAIAERLGRTEAGIRGKAMGCGIELVSDRAPAPISLRWQGAGASQANTTSVVPGRLPA